MRQTPPHFRAAFRTPPALRLCVLTAPDRLPCPLNAAGLRRALRPGAPTAAPTPHGAGQQKAARLLARRQALPRHDLPALVVLLQLSLRARPKTGARLRSALRNTTSATPHNPLRNPPSPDRLPCPLNAAGLRRAKARRLASADFSHFGRPLQNHTPQPAGQRRLRLPCGAGPRTCGKSAAGPNPATATDAGQAGHRAACPRLIACAPR